MLYIYKICPVNFKKNIEVSFLILIKKIRLENVSFNMLFIVITLKCFNIICEQKRFKRDDKWKVMYNGEMKLV